MAPYPEPARRWRWRRAGAWAWALVGVLAGCDGEVGSGDGDDDEVVGDGDIDDDGEPVPVPVPVVAPDDSDLAAVQAWLVSRTYQQWERYDPPPAPGMSGGSRVYLSPALAASLRAGAATHPQGSAAVREIVDAQDPTTMLGWALSHKLEADVADSPEPPAGDAWFFYEVFDLTAAGEPLVAERGAPGCVNCHGEGHDFVRSMLP